MDPINQPLSNHDVSLQMIHYNGLIRMFFLRAQWPIGKYQFGRHRTGANQWFSSADRNCENKHTVFAKLFKPNHRTKDRACDVHNEEEQFKTRIAKTIKRFDRYLGIRANSSAVESILIQFDSICILFNIRCADNDIEIIVVLNWAKYVK